MKTQNAPIERAFINILTESIDEPDLYAIELANGNTHIGMVADFTQDDAYPDYITTIGIRIADGRKIKYISVEQIAALEELEAEEA